MTRVACWFEGFTGAYPSVTWLCSCGASGEARRQDLAGEKYRARVRETEAAASSVGGDGEASPTGGTGSSEVAA